MSKEFNLPEYAPFARADDFQFWAPKIDGGWFLIELYCQGRVYTFSVSYLSEPFTSFLAALLELDEAFKKGGDASSVSPAEYRSLWSGESWRYCWSFWPRGQGREVAIRLEFAQHPDDKECLDHPWFEVCVPFDDLLQQWHAVGATILSELGLCGYKTEWLTRDFPWRDFCALHALVVGEENRENGVEDDLKILSRFKKENGPFLHLSDRIHPGEYEKGGVLADPKQEFSDPCLERFQRLPKRPVRREDVVDAVALKLFEAIESNTVISMRYTGGSEPGKQRRIMPIGLFSIEGYDSLYLQAFDIGKDAERIFRTDRIFLL